MCGIAGIFGSSLPALELAERARRMGDTLSHRGPDGSGLWVDAAAGFALAHRRLSILDLSSAGHQPMESADGRYVIAFNGEIYNHLELRERLEKSTAQAWPWRGHSDTETLLAAIAQWGVEKTLKATVGMFAFAFWDRHRRCLVLARDRLGEKPLYYGLVQGNLVFASELKAIRALPEFRPEIDREALALQLQYNYILEPYCIYQGIRKLPAGTWLECTVPPPDGLALGAPRQYWSATDVALVSAAQPRRFAKDQEAIAELDRLLRTAVSGQMVADVPLGAFLSGGIDSCTVVALMQAQSARPVKTFTIGFHEGDYDEAQHARAVARHLGTEHTELYVTAGDALAVIPDLPRLYDEPFSDASQIPTYLVSQMARQHVTVSLSGDGGDELFGGYRRYFQAQRWGRMLATIPRPWRQAAAAVLKLPATNWELFSRSLGPVLPVGLRHQRWGERLGKRASVLAGTGADLYDGLVSHWNPAQVLLGAVAPVIPLTAPWPELPRFFEQMMAIDAVTYLPGDNLTKIDRAAMAVSLETRVPLLDHRVYEFAWSLPFHYKVRGGKGKWLLRQVLNSYVPPALVERPKMGFGVPLDDWLRGPLRDWAESLLEEARLRREGYLNPAAVRSAWLEHLGGGRNLQYPLWDVLMFQAWLEANAGGK